MNLTLNIVRKDLFRLRWWLLAWFAVLALPIGLGFQALGQNPFVGTEWRGLNDTLKAAICLEILCGYLLVILLLQEDAIIGTRQFWLTRPIARGRLLLAKAIGVFLVLGLLPIAVSLPWWLWCGLGLPTMAQVSGDLLIIMVLVTLPAALVATLTETFPRALLWSLVLAAAIVTAIAAIPLMVLTGTSPGRIATRVVLAVLVVGLEMAAVTVLVFLWRRRSWWLVGAVGVVAGSFVLALRSNAQWWSSEPRERNVERAANITMRFEQSFAGVADERTPEKRQHVTTTVIVGGIPSTKLLVPVGGHQTWRSSELNVTHSAWPNWQSNLSRSFELLGLRHPPENAEMAAWHASRFGRPLKALAPDEGELGLGALLQRSVVARLMADPPSYEAHVFVTQLQPEIIVEVPQCAGARARGKDHTARIVQVLATPGHQRVSSRVTLVETRPITSWFMLREFARADSWMHHFRSLVSFHAFHRGRGEFTSVAEDKQQMIVVNGVAVTWHTLAVSPGWVRRDRAWVQREGWVDGVSLALVRMNEDATIARNVRAERVRIDKVRATDAGRP